MYFVVHLFFESNNIKTRTLCGNLFKLNKKDIKATSLNLVSCITSLKFYKNFKAAIFKSIFHLRKNLLKAFSKEENYCVEISSVLAT